jgi:hypothetical protein
MTHDSTNPGSAVWNRAEPPIATNARTARRLDAMDARLDQLRAQDACARLHHFDCDHLPTDLRAVSLPFQQMAIQLAQNLPASLQRAAALQALLISKDAAVRAQIDALRAMDPWPQADDSAP